MVWPAVIAAGAALANGFMSNASAKSREKAADYREFELSKQLWTHQMSNSHQLQVEDLKKAGLNPILSASAQSNTTGNVGGHISSGGNFENVLTNAVQAFQAHKQAQVQDSQVLTNEATAQNQTASAAEHAQNARRLKMENDYLEKDKAARDAKFGGASVSNPVQLGKSAFDEVDGLIGDRVREFSKRFGRLVRDKYDQFQDWFKTDSPIANAKQVDANIKRAYKRYQQHRKAHPLYGKYY